MDRLAVLARHLTTGGLRIRDEGDASLVSMAPTSVASPVQADMGRSPVMGGGRAEYDRLYKWSIDDPAGFWAKMAEDLHWQKRWQTDHHRFNFDMRKGRIFAEWFRGGKTNIAYNCLDRWVEAGKGNLACFLWEGNGFPVFRARTMSYREVLDEVCRLANWLREQGVRKGDAVGIYLPMICELPIAMLACARIGAMHTVVFAGFSAEALSQRLLDCKAKAVITATGVWRGPKTMALKSIVDDALDITAKGGHKVPACLVFEKSAVPAAKTPWVKGRDRWWQTEVRRQSNECPPEWMDAEDPLFLLYTSGSTGQPKGVLHTTGGYMVQAYVSQRYIFDTKAGDVFWCTADCGWVTGHTYLAYGPLLVGATQVLFGSTPTFPTVDRVWQVIERYRVRVFYTAPTLIRALMQHGDEPVQKHDRSSLRVLGTVGEPIGNAAWQWFDQVVGEGRCPIVDTWWQTETGSIMLTPIAGAWQTVPGCATLPFFGVHPVLLTEKGEEISESPAEGILAIKSAWPSMMRTLYQNQERFEKTYFEPFKGYYFAGDGAKRDANGYFTITGRVDDVINVSGHRIGTAEVEAALTAVPACSEAAVIGIDHKVKGQALYAFVSLSDQASSGDKEKIRKALIAKIRSQIGAFAVPEVIHWAPGLPKTRSGKIMRRILRKIADKNEDLGDTSSLADPGVVDEIIKMRPQE